MILLGVKNNEKVSDAVSTLRIVSVDLMKFLLSNSVLFLHETIDVQLLL